MLAELVSLAADLLYSKLYQHSINKKTKKTLSEEQMKHWEKNNPADRSQILLSDQQECTPPFGNQQNVELTELEHSLPCYILSFSAPTTHLLPLQQAIYTNF